MLWPWILSNPVIHVPFLGPWSHCPMPHWWWWGSGEMPGYPVHADMNGNEWLSCEPRPQSEAWFQGFWVMVYGQFLEFLMMSTVQNCVPRKDGKKAWEFDRHPFRCTEDSTPTTLDFLSAVHFREHGEVGPGRGWYFIKREAQITASELFILKVRNWSPGGKGYMEGERQSWDWYPDLFPHHKAWGSRVTHQKGPYVPLQAVSKYAKFPRDGSGFSNSQVLTEISKPLRAWKTM